MPATTPASANKRTVTSSQAAPAPATAPLRLLFGSTNNSATASNASNTPGSQQANLIAALQQQAAQMNDELQQAREEIKRIKVENAGAHQRVAELEGKIARTETELEDARKKVKVQQSLNSFILKLCSWSRLTS